MTRVVDFDQASLFSTPEESPGFLLWRVSMRWRRTIESALKPLGLTHPQFVILATTGWLTRNGMQATQADVGRQAGLDPNTTSQILRGLEAKGLVKRTRTSDEKSKFPVLTAKGGRYLAKALPAVEHADAEFFGACDLKKERLFDGMKKLAAITY